MKRQRFIATVTPPLSNAVQQIDILDYSAERAQALLDRKGYTTLEAPRLKRDVIRQAARRCSWRIDHAAIRRDFLALTGRELPCGLTIQTEAVTSREGWFIAHPDGRLTLAVSAAVPASRASEVLWHELCHLNQYLDCVAETPHLPATRDAFMAWRERCKRENALRTGYYNRPREIEARSWEPLGQSDPLVKKIGG